MEENNSSQNNQIQGDPAIQSANENQDSSQNVVSQPTNSVSDQLKSVMDQPNQPKQVKYAGFWIRFVAAIIDSLVLMIPQIVVSGVLSITLRDNLISQLASYLVMWTYYIWMTNKYQATLGKKAVGIRVLSDKSEKLTLGQIILRETVGKLISMFTLLIGYIVAGVTARKQSLHDKIASTTVVYNNPDKKFPTWAIVLICVVPFIFIVIFGILVSITLVSLSSARTKASDAGIKSYVASMIPDAILYQDEKGSLKGYSHKIDESMSLFKCSGAPIINISDDGLNMAVFAKLCSDESKYFCADVTGAKYIEVDEIYAKSGKSICLGSTPIAIEVADYKGAKNNNQYNLNENVEEDISMINKATESAKKWQLDAKPYIIFVIDNGVIGNDERVVIFKSKNIVGKIFGVTLDFKNNIIHSSEEQDQLGDLGHIDVNNLKISSADAFKMSENFAKGIIKNSRTDYNLTLGLSYNKKMDSHNWVYVLVNKEIESDVVRINVEDSTGRIIDTTPK